jgi:hypothetical protein
MICLLNTNIVDQVDDADQNQPVQWSVNTLMPG